MNAKNNVIYVDFRRRERALQAGEVLLPLVVCAFAGAAFAYLVADLFGDGRQW